MTLSHDLFAETNPAFGAFLAIAFCRSFQESAGSPPNIALLYLAMPIAMSSDTQASFTATNVSTGLLSWLKRFPAVQHQLGQRLDASLSIVTASLRFGFSSRALAMGDDGAVSLGYDAPAKAYAARLPIGPKQAMKRSERLGVWMADAGTPGSIFSAFGVTP
jgi:hypothetical protein